MADNSHSRQVHPKRLFSLIASHWPGRSRLPIPGTPASHWFMLADVSASLSPCHDCDDCDDWNPIPISFPYPRPRDPPRTNWVGCREARGNSSAVPDGGRRVFVGRVGRRIGSEAWVDHGRWLAAPVLAPLAVVRSTRPRPALVRWGRTALRTTA